MNTNAPTSTNMAVDNDGQQLHFNPGAQQHQLPMGSVATTYPTAAPPAYAAQGMVAGSGMSTYQSLPLPHQPAVFAPQHHPNFATFPTTTTMNAPVANMPPLMPIALTTPAVLPWSCPDPARMCMVHNDPRCMTCATYMQHVLNAEPDLQYRQAHEDARTAQQAAYWDHLQRWQASKGEGAEEISRLRGENNRLKEKVTHVEERNKKAWDAFDAKDKEVKELRRKLQDSEREGDELRRRLEGNLRHHLDEDRRDRRARSRSPVRLSYDDRRDRRDTRPERRRSPPRAVSARYHSPSRAGSSRRPPSPQHGSDRDRRTLPPQGSSRQPSVQQARPSRDDHPRTVSHGTLEEVEEGEMDNAPRNPQVRLPQSRADVATQQQPAKPPTGETSQQQPAKPQATAGTSQPSTSRRQPGLTEDAYKFLDDDWSDEEPDEAEAIDLDEVRKHKSRMQYRGFRKPVATKGKGKAPERAASRERLSPPLGEEQFSEHLLPDSVPSGATPESCNWPSILQWPTPTDVKLADAWHRYVPVTPSQAQALMTQAKEQGDGALWRIRHLIAQIDRTGGYMGVAGLKYIKNNWRGISNDTKPPTHFSSVHTWEKWYARNPQNIPRYLATDPSNPNAIPPPALIEGHTLMRRFLPTASAGQSSLRASALHHLVRILSVHGLYHHIRQRGQYPEGPVENIRPYPLNIANISEFDVVRWAARCGVTDRTVLLMENVARRQRNADSGREVDCIDAWPDYPRSLNDIVNVPSEDELPSLSEMQPAPLPAASGGTPAATAAEQQDVEMGGMLTD